MDSGTLLLIAILSLITTSITSLVGFADKVALIAVLTFFIDIRSAIIAAAFYSLIISVGRIVVFKKHLNKKLCFKMYYYLVPGIILGLIIFDSINSNNLGLLFSGFLLLYVTYKVFLSDKLSFSVNDIGLGIGIFLFGIIETVLGGAGPLLAVILLQYGKRNEDMVVFIAAMFIVSNIIRLGGYAYLGHISIELAPILILVSIVAVVGTYAGKYLLKFLSPRAFEAIVLLLLTVIGLNGFIVA